MADEEKVKEKVSSGAMWLLLRGLVVIAVFAVAALVAYVVWQMQSDLPTWFSAVAAGFGAVGLLSIFAWATGGLSLPGGDHDRQFFDAMTDAMSDACVVTDTKSRAVYANGPYLKLASKAGVARLVGFDILYAGYPEFAEPIYQLMQAARDGNALHRDIRVGPGSSAPGSQADNARWLRISVSPLHANAKGGRHLWRLTDISSDRAHQEQAFSRLQFIITYLDHAPVGFFSTLPGGKVDYVNATLANWLGLDLVDAQAGKIDLTGLIGEDGAKILTAVVPVVGGHRIDRFSFPVADKAAHTHLYDFINRVDFDGEGKVLPSRTMVMRRDPANEAGLIASDNIAQFLSTVPIGIAEVDQKGALVGANAEFLSLAPAIKLGSSLVATLKPEFAVDVAASLADVNAVGAVATSEVIFGGDSPRNVQLTFTRLAGMGDKISVFALDRTEHKALEVQLAQSQKMQAVGELASGIAHDFNNVLTPIIGFADLLLSKMRPIDPAFADVMSIKQNANRAANLVRQLLAFSRKQTLQPKMIDLSEAMSDLGNLLGRVLGEKTELAISHGRDLWTVWVDIHQFEQVIINLAVNARDAMPKGGKLFVRTYNLPREKSQGTGNSLPDADYVVCEVEDSGTGIPKDILDKIWTPFFTTKEVGKGTGLGLSMVYGIVKQTGGFIYCDSVMGKGTTFRIYLPRFVPDVSAAALVPVVTVAPKREDFSGRGRILVVEDEDSVRAFAVRALTSRGYTVLEADSGEVALEVIADDKDGFELILSDVVMPEMDGPSMLKELRNRKIMTKVIFMSGYAEEAFERNLDGAADFAFLQKPFSLKQLVEKVKEVMG
jgi:two-component system, cell cycle sensor histidine kinase and response regulator CckA